MRRPQTADGGETLLEILIAVAIMGIAFVSILAGLGTATKASTYHRSQSEVQLAARDIAEAVKAQAFLPCVGVTPPAYTFTNPDSTTSASLSVKYYTSGTFSSTCNSTTQLQLVTVTVTPTNGRAAAATLTFTKRAS